MTIRRSVYIYSQRRRQLTAERVKFQAPRMDLGKMGLDPTSPPPVLCEHYFNYCVFSLAPFYLFVTYAAI